jgi:hypothetical protein
VRIGVDFDNTVVGYDALFHRVAIERGLVQADVTATKLGVRDYLRGVGREDAWTEMQGYVYGARMQDAIAYPGALQFFAWARQDGHAVFIVSHKTRIPFAGHPYDLHEAARGWIATHLERTSPPLLNGSDAYFELTKAEKLARIGRLGLDWYVDDLPEILTAPDFPHLTGRILFDPDLIHGAPPDTGIAVFDSWRSIQSHIQQQCRSKT